VALLLNHVILEPGEAIYLGAGNLHAYIAGIGVEVMANSDNVLRGGLTTKHADVHELLSVISCEPGRPPVQRPDASGRYRTPAEEFELSVITTATVSGPAIALCTAGTLNVAGELLQAGESAFIRADEQVGLAADGQSHVATVGTLIGSTPG
jgi:mannose-6-phosphate isomerase